MSSDENSGVIQSIARAGKSFPPSPAVTARALLDEEAYRKLYDRSIQDPEGFWADMAAQELVWSRRWDRVLDWKPPQARWFDGGTLNVSENCLDRHLATRGDKVALIWEGEPGDEVKLTYRELH
ncbi:MAG: acetyl-coenzyme A synthetase N-terminal domain-containing protein, partial [Polyangia bacterium]